MSSVKAAILQAKTNQVTLFSCKYINIISKIILWQKLNVQMTLITDLENGAELKGRLRVNGVVVDIPLGWQHD